MARWALLQAVVWSTVSAVVLGALSGLAASLVRLGFRGLQWLLTGSAQLAPVAASQLSPWRRCLTPVLGALGACVVVQLRARRAHRLGRAPRPFVDYAEAVQHEFGRIPVVPNLWRTAASACSIGSGASIGREGSMIQFAASVSSWVARRTAKALPGVPWMKPSLAVACGVAASVAVAYSAPVAGVFFAAEIALRSFAPRRLLPLAIASMTGWAVSLTLLGRGPLYATPWPVRYAPGETATLLLLAAGVGALGPLYRRLLRGGKQLSRLPLAMVWGGLAVGLLSLLDPRVWGNADAGLSAALGQGGVPGVSIGMGALTALLGLRLLATTLCVGTGMIGGIITPTLFAGAVLGSVAAHLLRLGVPLSCAAARMSALLGVVMEAPLTAALLTVELTGNWRAAPLVLGASLAAWATAWALAGSSSRQALTGLAAQLRQGPPWRAGTRAARGSKRA